MGKIFTIMWISHIFFCTVQTDNVLVHQVWSSCPGFIYGASGMSWESNVGKVPILPHKKNNILVPFLGIPCSTGWFVISLRLCDVYIYVSKLTIIASHNGLSPGRRQTIIWTNAGILLIGPLVTKFSENLGGIQTFSFKKMHLKMSYAKRRPFCLGLDVLNKDIPSAAEAMSCLSHTYGNFEQFQSNLYEVRCHSKMNTITFVFGVYKGAHRFLRNTLRDWSSIQRIGVVWGIIKTFKHNHQIKGWRAVSLALVGGIHRWQVVSPHKGPVTRKMFAFDDAIIITGK